MTAATTYTYDATTPYRPALADLGGADYENDPLYVPDRTTMPNAEEANERARALGQAAEHINRLDAALRGLLSTVERLDISEGVCCCGDDMATHAEPMSCGHTPVDAGHYHHGNAIQQARDAIEHGAGK